MTKQQKKTKPAWQIKVINGVKVLIPFCPDAEKTLEKYHVNQVVTGNVTGTRKERSLKQNNLYFKACSFFSYQTGENRFKTTEHVDAFMRNQLQYYDLSRTIVLKDSRVCFITKPLNFAGCEQAEANKYYQQAFEAMALYLGVDVDVFIEEVKMEMG